MNSNKEAATEAGVMKEMQKETKLSILILNSRRLGRLKVADRLILLY